MKQRTLWEQLERSRAALTFAVALFAATAVIIGVWSSLTWLLVLVAVAGTVHELGWLVAVISAVGTRPYYRRLGFRDGDLYQHRRCGAAA